MPLPPMWPQGDMGRWGGVPGSDCTLLVLAPHRASVCSQQACAPDSELESNHTLDFRETEQLAKPLSDTVADTLLLAAILFASGLGAFSVFAGVNGDVCPPLQRNTEFSSAPSTLRAAHCLPVLPSAPRSPLALAASALSFPQSRRAGLTRTVGRAHWLLCRECI